jgi:hypothetical protein
MARKNLRQQLRRSKAVHDFRLLDRPVVRSEAGPPKIVARLDNIALPPAYGAPMLVAIARDPRTIFLYWSIDWPTLFAKSAPADRQVHLRVYQADGSEQQSVAVEPMAGNCYVMVPLRTGPYHVEIGYYQPADVWHSIATSNEVTMPRDDLTTNRDVDLATIPLHLKFERLLDLLAAANGNALAKIISQFQTRAVTEDMRKQLRSDERESLRGMNLSLEEIAAGRGTFMRGADEAALNRIAEAILVFGSTSPSCGFSPSSWQGG